MAVTTTEKFYLDFYTNNIINITAKQLDHNSRFINITCTEFGKKVMLNPATSSVFIRWKKSDGKNIFKMGEILEDGSILVQLNQQMLVSEGRQSADILITQLLADEAKNVTDLEELFNNNEAIILSTMKFNINVIAAPFVAGKVVSEDDITALTEALQKFEDKYSTVLMSIKLCDKATDNAKVATDNANQKLQEVNDLLGSITDDATKSTLYGIKKACEEAIIAAKNATQQAEDMATYVSNLTGTKSDVAGTETVYGAIASAKVATEYAQQVAKSYETELNNRVKKTGDEMTGDLLAPNINVTNLKATEKIQLGSATMTYDTAVQAVIVDVTT